MANPTPLFVNSNSPGVCHVVLTFSSGYVYQTDILFVTQTNDTADCAQCSYVAPTQSGFHVDNQAAACDAGVDGQTDAAVDGTM